MANGRHDVMQSEAGAIAELAALHRDPVFYGRGVPRGDGRLVVVVPGLFGNDLYLQPLRGWLSRIGYTPQRSGLRINAGCPERLRNEVARSIARQLDRRAGPIALIGHSRGGMLCWSLASRLQDRVSHFVLLGSPAPAVAALFASGTSDPPTTVARRSVADAGTRALKMMDPDCTVPACGCPYVEDLQRRLSPATRVLSIHSPDDQIVRPEACRVSDGDNVEVRGTHSGLAFNRAAYRHVGRFLATT
jgi:triacylglycerol lipase